MLIAIILCLFSVAFGSPYYIRLDDGVPLETKPVTDLQSHLGPSHPGRPQPPSWEPPPPRPPQSLCCAARLNCCHTGPSLSQASNKIIAQNAIYHQLQNSGIASFGTVSSSIPHGRNYLYVKNPAFNLPYNRNYYYGGSQGAYGPRYEQEIPVSVYSQQLPVVAVPYARSLQNVQEVSPIGQQVGQSQVPSNVKVRGQAIVQSAADVNNVQQVVGGVPNSYLPLIGYSQQLPVVSVPYARSIDGQVVSNVGIRAVNGVNGHVGSVGSLATGGSSILIHK